MISKETLENLESVRNIELKRKPNPCPEFLSFLEKITADEELGQEYEEFMNAPDLEEREKQAECIIRQLKVFYKAKGWNVYEHESGIRMMLHKPADLYNTEVYANVEYGLLNLKIQIPIIISGEDSMNRLARALHNFNQDNESAMGYFSLDDANGRVDYLYQYGFEDGTFTEEGFHRILSRSMRAVKDYYTAILALTERSVPDGYDTRDGVDNRDTLWDLEFPSDALKDWPDDSMGDWEKGMVSTRAPWMDDPGRWPKEPIITDPEDDEIEFLDGLEPEDDAEGSSDDERVTHRHRRPIRDWL